MAMSSKAMYRWAAIWALGITIVSCLICNLSFKHAYGWPDSLIFNIAFVPMFIGYVLVICLSYLLNFIPTLSISDAMFTWVLLPICSFCANFGIAWIITLVIVKMRKHKISP